MATYPFLTHIDLNKNELQNAVIQNLAVAPSSPKVGQLYFDTVVNHLKVWDGTQWISTMEIPQAIQQHDYAPEIAQSLADAKAYADEKFSAVRIDYKAGFEEVLDLNDETINDKLKGIAGLTSEQEEIIVNKARDKAKEKVDELRTELLGGTPAEDLDTLMELAEKVKEHGNLIEVLKQMPKTYIQENVGDGVATSHAINHNLDTLWLDVAVYTPQGERVYVSFTCTDRNNLTIHTGSSALNGHTVKVMG